MNWGFSVPLLVLASSLLPGLLIFRLQERQHRLRTWLNMLGATLKLFLVAWVIRGVYEGRSFEARFPLSLGLELSLRADDVSLLFMGLSATLWFFTTIYAIGYLEGSSHRNRFFGFFSLCVTSTMGVAMAGNLITFLIFYEMLTVVTYPLVVHRGTVAALRAGRVYLVYTLGGGAGLLLGILWIHALAGPVDFTHRGVLSGLGPEHHGQLIGAFALLIGSLGVKAALVPLHGWLPVAMIAPAPVSALLHAVAVVKAGAYGILRVVYDIYGIEFAAGLGLLNPLAAVACVTIVYGSLRALYQTDLKRRLAFSTVSQISYIVLGTAILGPIATTGGLVHLVHQGLMKITLFFCAGNLAETLGIHKVSDLSGVGRRMPVTMAAFTVAALGMIGVPPVSGFVSKWYLGVGAAQSHEPWVLLVLATSSLLNAAYFLPIIRAAWFGESTAVWPRREAASWETSGAMLLPTVATACLALAAGVLASAEFSPLSVAERIVQRMYRP